MTNNMPLIGVSGRKGAQNEPSTLREVAARCASDLKPRVPGAPAADFVRRPNMIEMDEYPQSKEPNVVLHYRACLCRGTGKMGKRTCKSNRVVVLERSLWVKMGKPATADETKILQVP